MAYSTLVNNVICQIINSWPNRKLLNYKYIEQIRDISSSIVASLVMGVAVWLIGCISLPIFIKLGFQILIGIIVYVLLSYLTRIEPFVFLLEMIKNRMQKTGGCVK